MFKVKAPQILEEWQGEKKPLSPEQQLWAAVLAKAILDYKNGINDEKFYQHRGTWRISAEERRVECYLNSNEWFIGSFKYICHALFDDPDGFMKLIRRHLKGIDVSRKRRK